MVSSRAFFEQQPGRIAEPEKRLAAALNEKPAVRRNLYGLGRKTDERD
jgi:hypothetical protein